MVLSAKDMGSLRPWVVFEIIFRLIYTILLPFYPGSFRLCVEHGRLGLLGFAIHLIPFLPYFCRLRQKSTVSY